MIGDRKLLTKPSEPGNPSWDNENYDLILHTGDVITDGTKKYSIISLLGNGTFGQVVNCIDHETGKGFAIKIAKSPRVYYTCSHMESQILERLRMQSPRYFVQIFSSFIFKQHHCLVLEVLGRNLYEVLKLRNFNGFPHSTVKSIAEQILNAMVEMSRIGVVHCDLKPENILVEDPRTMRIKIIDFGSAFYFFKDNGFYVQSRYYRAPEVMMNMAYDSSVDVWSFACIAFELCVGRPLFPGKSNNNQLARIFFLLDDRLCTEQPRRERIEDIIEHKDAFLTTQDVRALVGKASTNAKDNQNFCDFLFAALRIRTVERPGAADLLKHAYLNDASVHGGKKVVLDNLEAVEARDQHHPPPQIFGTRRYTTFSGKAKEQAPDTRRKKSQVQDSYKHGK